MGGGKLVDDGMEGRTNGRIDRWMDGLVLQINVNDCVVDHSLFVCWLLNVPATG